MVMLFTNGVEQHEARLRRLLGHPKPLRVQRATRSLQEVESSHREVVRLLLGEKRQLGVWSVGIGVRDGQLVVAVGINPYDEDSVRRVRRATAPHAVAVEERGPACPLGDVSRTSSRWWLAKADACGHHP